MGKPSKPSVIQVTIRGDRLVHRVVFDGIGEGYRAMDERGAIEAPVKPQGEWR